MDSISFSFKKMEVLLFIFNYSKFVLSNALKKVSLKMLLFSELKSLELQESKPFSFLFKVIFRTVLFYTDLFSDLAVATVLWKHRKDYQLTELEFGSRMFYPYLGYAHYFISIFILASFPIFVYECLPIRWNYCT